MSLLEIFNFLKKGFLSPYPKRDGIKIFNDGGLQEIWQICIHISLAAVPSGLRKKKNIQQHFSPSWPFGMSSYIIKLGHATNKSVLWVPLNHNLIKFVESNFFFIFTFVLNFAQSGKLSSYHISRFSALLPIAKHENNNCQPLILGRIVCISCLTSK